MVCPSARRESRALNEIAGNWQFASARPKRSSGSRTTWGEPCVQDRENQPAQTFTTQDDECIHRLLAEIVADQDASRRVSFWPSFVSRTSQPSSEIRSRSSSLCFQFLSRREISRCSAN